MTKIYGKCVHCEKPITKLEAEQSVMSNEDWDNLTCDDCASEQGAEPSEFEKMLIARAEAYEMDLKVGDKLVARQKGKQTWKHVGVTATVVGLNRGSVDLEFDDGHNVPWTKPVDAPDSRGVYWEKVG